MKGAATVMPAKAMAETGECHQTRAATAVPPNPRQTMIETPQCNHTVDCK
jgi:hypothetical protein